MKMNRFNWTNRAYKYKDMKVKTQDFYFESFACNSAICFLS